MEAFRSGVSSSEPAIGAECQYYLGEMFYRMEKWGRAATEFEKLSDLFPDRGEWVQAALVKAGESWELGNRYDKALLAYEKALKAAPAGPRKDSIAERMRKADERRKEFEKLEKESKDLEKKSAEKSEKKRLAK